MENHCIKHRIGDKANIGMNYENKIDKPKIGINVLIDVLCG